MKISRSFFFVACCFLSLEFSMLVGCQVNSIRGSGVIETVEIEVSDFHGVKASGAGTVIIHANQEQTKVVYSFDDNLTDIVKINVNDGILNIRTVESYSTQEGLKVEIWTAKCDSVNFSGAVKSTIEGLETKDFKVNCSGASKVTAMGNAESVSVGASGACQVDLKDVVAKVVFVDANGASKVQVYATDEFDAKASGASNVSYKGDPKVTKSESGVGKVSNSK